MAPSVPQAAASLQAALADARKGLVDRDALVELVALAAVAGEHLLVIGPPGTAKSEAVRRVARAMEGRYFEYLLGRFTEPSEIFGPIDLRKLKDGLVETQTSGMLPEAEIAFLDEVFLGSTAILNTLLAILNERTFARGHTRVACPLKVCVGASNALPEDSTLAAFADRFLLRVFIEPIADPQIEELLEAGWSSMRAADGRKATMADLDALAVAAKAVDLSPVRTGLAHAIRLLRKNGIVLTDRRAVRAQSTIAAAAVLRGRTAASDSDLWPIVFSIPTGQEQALARELLRDLLHGTENAVLPAAAGTASMGPLARAALIESAGQEALASRPVDYQGMDAWRLKLEGIAREIDAGFPKETMPPGVAALRAKIVETLAPNAS
jgi:MoxR-like ATPase